MSQSILDIEFNSLNFWKTTTSNVIGARESTEKRLTDRAFENKVN